MLIVWGQREKFGKPSTRENLRMWRAILSCGHCGRRLLPTCWLWRRAVSGGKRWAGAGRYFGGTKLGAGGLVSAYKTAAELALNQCKIIQRELTADIELFFEYWQMAPVMRLQHEAGAEVISQVFETSCFACWRIGLGKLPAFEEKIKNIPVKMRIKN